MPSILGCRLKHHIIDALNQLVLFCIEHVIISLIELVPQVRVAWIMSSQNEDEIILLKLGVFLWVRHNVFYDLSHVLFPITHVLNLRRVVQNRVFYNCQVYILLPVQTQRNHVSSGG